MNAEKILLLYGVFCILLFVAVHLFRILRRSQRQKRKKLRSVAAEQSTLEHEIISDQTRTIEIMWSDIASHDKVGEYLKVNGVINGVANYYFVARICTFKSFGVIQLSVADKLLTPSEGSEALAHLKGSDYCIFRYSGERGITVDLHKVDEGIKQSFSRDSKAFLAIENKMSLIKGNSIELHFKQSEPECRFIKHWEMPTSFASFAAFSDSSQVASVAQKALSTEAFQERRGETLIPTVAQLVDNTFYVLGADDVYNLKLLSEGQLALRLIIGEELEDVHEDELDQVLAAIRKQPLVHMKIRMDKSKTPFVVFRKENDVAETAVNLAETNVIVSIPVDSKDQLEIIRIENCDEQGGLPVLHMILNGMSSNHCPYAVVWKY